MLLNTSDPPPSGLLADIHFPILLAIITTFVTAILMIRYRARLDTVMRDRDDERAVQASHVGTPQRLGGVAIFLGILVGLQVVPHDVSTLPFLVVVSATPVVLAGLLEDLGYGVDAHRRLAAAFVSAALALLLLGVWVSRADLSGLDRVLEIMALGSALTLVVSAGFCHATNLVDGMNGLAATVVISSSVGVWLIADAVMMPDLALLAALLAASMTGFLLLNWPAGALFLGDAGSYGVGHVLIWLVIVLAARAPDVAMPALALIVFWPFADTLHSIARRLVSRKPVFAPDRMHLHQKTRRCIEIVFLGGAHLRRSNPMATAVLAPMIVMPVVAGVMLVDNALAAWSALILFGTLFGVTHLVVTRMALRHRRKLSSPGALQ